MTKSLNLILLFLVVGCSLPTAKEAGLKFSTEKSKLPDSLGT